MKTSEDGHRANVASAKSSDDRGGRNIIVDGLKDDRWSILVGPDAERLD
jgi:hypothetical protein